MSRSLQAPVPTSSATSRGRHRLDRASGVRACDLPGVRELLAQREGDVRPRNAFLRWLTTSPAAGRHTWSFLAGSGGRPRTAFAIILSL